MTMPLSVRLDPTVEARLEQEARRLGISKSEFVKDALERTLGMKNPAQLLKQVRTGTPNGDASLSESVKKNMLKKLHEKHSD